MNTQHCFKQKYFKAQIRERGPTIVHAIGGKTLVQSTREETVGGFA
jgi:hypothetical protein